MELTPKQTRQLIDTEQAFQSWRNARDEFEHGYEGSYAGKMKWRKRSSGEYLYRIRKDGRELVLGRRSPENRGDQGGLHAPAHTIERALATWQSASC